MRYRLFVFSLLLFAGFFSAAAQKSKLITKGKSTVTPSKSSATNVLIETSLGKITIQLFEDKAPKHAENFKKLAKDDYYVGTTFHRVIPGFMVQGGDSNSKDDDRSNDGMGSPGYLVDAEIGVSHDRGVIAAARQGDGVNPQRKSNGSQFYITVAAAKFLDGQYSVFGKVIDGMDVADKIAAVPRDPSDNPVERVVIKKVTILP